MTPPPHEDSEDRRERLRLEGMHSALQRRPSPQAQEDERSRAGHAAKAGFRGTTMLLVIAGIFVSLAILSMASKALKLREDPPRPGSGRAR